MTLANKILIALADTHPGKGGENVKIVIERETGAIKSAPELTQQQRGTLWAEIVRNYARKHPEIFEREQEKGTEKEA